MFPDIFLSKSSMISGFLFHNSYTMNCYIRLHGKKIILEKKTVSNKNLRNVIRIIHLVAAVTFGMYFYSPISGDQTLRLIIQFVTLPGIALTGIALWQQAYLNKILSHNTHKSTAHSAHLMPKE